MREPIDPEVVLLRRFHKEAVANVAAGQQTQEEALVFLHGCSDFLRKMSPASKRDAAAAALKADETP